MEGERQSPLLFVGPSALKISLGPELMTTTMMFRFSYVSALILFLLGILNIVFAWKTHSYLYTADIKRQTIVSYQEHAVFTMMALDRSSHISVQNEQLEGEQRKSTRGYLLVREYGRSVSDACRG